MADPPRPRTTQPPPLPPEARPIPVEPFVDLTAEAPPDTVRTRRDEVPPPPPHLVDLLQLVAGLLEVHRQELIYTREVQPTLPVIPTPPTAPESLRTVTKKAIAARLSAGSVLGFLIPLLGAEVARRWPEYADLARLVFGWLP